MEAKYRKATTGERAGAGVGGAIGGSIVGVLAVLFLGSRVLSKDKYEANGKYLFGAGILLGAISGYTVAYKFTTQTPIAWDKEN